MTTDTTFFYNRKPTSGMALRYLDNMITLT